MFDELDTEKLVEEAAKITGEEETPSESATEETPPEEKTSEEKPSEEETPGTETPLKTEEKPKEEETEDDTRFDKHPRWIKLRERAETAEERVKVADDFEQRLGDLSVEELTRLKNAGGLLRKYPELAQKVQKVIDEHPYGNEETKTEIESVKREQENLRYELALDKYDNAVDKLISENKVDKDIEPLVREVLENRVINKKLTAKTIPQAFEEALKDVNLAYRKKLASHIETKKSETKVPASPVQKGKVITTKSEATDIGSVVDELAEGLKSHRGEPIKE